MPDPRPTHHKPSPATKAFEDFHAQYAARLIRAVAVSVHTPDHTIIDDACQHAWLQLARRDDVTLDDRGANWLMTVAIRQGWRLASVRRDIPSGAFRGPSDNPELELSEPPTLDGDPEALAISRESHDQRATDLAKLRPDQRRALYLLALGLSYQEIADATGTSYTAVNRRINEGRAKLATLDRVRKHHGE